MFVLYFFSVEWYTKQEPQEGKHVREIGYLKASLHIRRKHWKRLKVNIAHNAVFSHHIIELVAVLIVLADKPYKIQMTAAPVVFVIGWKAVHPAT